MVFSAISKWFLRFLLGRQARLFQQEPKPRISSYIFKELIPPEPSEENLAALVLLEDGPNQRVVLFEELERDSRLWSSLKDTVS